MRGFGFDLEQTNWTCTLIVIPETFHFDLFVYACAQSDSQKEHMLYLFKMFV